MYRIFLTLVDVVPAALVLIPLFLIFHFALFRRNTGKTILYCIFCLYMSAVFSLVGIPNVTYIRPELNLNLIPLVDIPFDLKNSLLNVLLFLPLGFMLPVLWERYRKLRHTAAFGFGLSLSIELLQMLTYRMTDVNDLFTNTFGAVAGFWLAMPLVRRCRALEGGKRTAYLLCLLSFGVMFFLHPILSPLIWDRIL